MARKKLEINIEEFIYMRDVEKKSYAYIASCFGISHHSVLTRWLKRNGVQWKNHEAVKGGWCLEYRPSKVDKRAVELGFKNAEDFVARHRESETVEGIAKTLMCNKSTVWRKTPKNLIGKIQIMSPEGKARQLAGLAKGRKKIMKMYFDGNHFWTRHHKNTIKQKTLEEMAKTRLKIFGGDMSAEQLGRELEGKQRKGVGMYFTSKDLLSGSDITIEVETGAFLGNAHGYLVKGLTVNPPHNSSAGKKDSPS